MHRCLNEIVALWGSSWISALDSFPLLRVNIQHLDYRSKKIKPVPCCENNFMSFVLSKKLPNPVFARLLKEVVRRDKIITRLLNNYKVSDVR